MAKLANYSPAYREAYAAFEWRRRVEKSARSTARARYVIIHPEGVEIDTDAVEHEIDRLVWLRMDIQQAAHAVLLLAYVERDQWLAELSAYGKEFNSVKELCRNIQRNGAVPIYGRRRHRGSGAV